MAKKLDPGKRTNTGVRDGSKAVTGRCPSSRVLVRGGSVGHGHLHLRADDGRHPASNRRSRQELYRRLMSHDPEKMTMANSARSHHREHRQGAVAERRVAAFGRGRELGRALRAAVVSLRRRAAVQRGEVVPDLSPGAET